jgi:hypothetical protein
VREYKDSCVMSDRHPENLYQIITMLQQRLTCDCWAEARVKIARMNLTFKLDRNWSSFQLANSAPPLSVTDSAIAPSARMATKAVLFLLCLSKFAPACTNWLRQLRQSRQMRIGTINRLCWQKLASCLPLKKFCYG